MIKHITYTNDLMTISAERCRRSALLYGAEESKVYTRNDIDSIFLTTYPFTSGHFCDYWAWKPYIIFHELHKMSPGEILVYSDAGIEFINSFKPIINSMVSEYHHNPLRQPDIFLFSNGFKHSEWCKMDVMKAVGVEPGEERQVQASLMFFRVGAAAKKFVTEWFSYCFSDNLIDDTPSKEKNVPTFAAHRHDQAILSTLAIRDKIQLHWYPVTTAYHIKSEYSDRYPECALHHRLRNNEYKSQCV